MKVWKFACNVIMSVLIISTGTNIAFKSEETKNQLSIQKKILSPKQIHNSNLKANKTINLDEIPEILKSKNKELEIMKSRIEQNKYSLRSKIAAWYPSLNLSSSGFPQYLNANIDNELSTNTSSDQWKTSISATIKWDLINPSRIPDIDESKDQLEESILNYKIKFREIYLEALNKFFMLQRSNEYVEIAKKSIEISETSLKEAEIRLESGIGTKFEVLEAKAQLAKDRQFLIKKVGEKNINQSSLAKILNLNRQANPIINGKTDLIGQWKISLSESIEAAFKVREEIEKERIKISINNNQIKSSSGSNKPTLSLFNTFSLSTAQGEVGVASPNSSNNIHTQSNTIGLQVDWPMFNGGSVKALTKVKKEKQKELLAQLILKENEIRHEVEESFFNLEIAEQNISNTKLEVDSAKESLRLALIRLKAGITTQREVVTNQRDLTQAEVNHIEAITDYNSSLAKLSLQTGINKINQVLKNEGSK